jgi:CRP-like cAMP-binding protein
MQSGNKESIVVSKDDLKSILVLRRLNDEMLNKLLPIIDILHFEKEELILKEGHKGTYFYMLKQGKVILEKKISDSISFSAGSIKAGYSFGWSAVLEEGHYTLAAIASERCQVYAIKGEKIKKLLNDDHSMGFAFTQRFLHLIKSRLDRRTEQLIRLLTQHPDIKSLNEDQ